MMETVLIDTDVASFLFKKSVYAAPFRPFIRGKRAALAFVSVAELYRWAVKRQWGAKKIEQLEYAMHRYIVVPYDRDLAWAWARVVTACDEAGRPIAPSDAWVAAVDIRYGISLLTNNVKHFETAESLCGLKLLRPAR